MAQQSMRRKKLTPNCISIKINGENAHCQKTIKAATQYRLNHISNFTHL
jgi:hypothetical protein